MRKTFAAELVKLAEKDKSIWVISIDLGYGMWNEFKEKYPERYINTGAAESAAMDIAVGLAMSGKKPFIYSITPFLLWRGAESIRLYVDHEKIPVRLVGSGRNADYFRDGISHDATDSKDLIGLFPNIVEYWPVYKEEIPEIVKEMVNSNVPQFVSLIK
jgi:transketolase